MGGFLRSVFARRFCINGRIDVDLMTEVGSLIHGQLPPYASVNWSTHKNTNRAMSL